MNNFGSIKGTYYNELLNRSLNRIQIASNAIYRTRALLTSHKDHLVSAHLSTSMNALIKLPLRRKLAKYNAALFVQFILTIVHYVLQLFPNADIPLYALLFAS